MSTTDRIKELETARAEVAILEQAIAAELNTELAALPGQYGFESAADFVAAVMNATGTPRGREPGRAAVAAVVEPADAKPSTSAGKKRRTRAVITDATRAQVKELVAAGKSGSEIAKAVGISLPSVHNIKKALGLVKKSGKTKAEVTPAAAAAKPKAAMKSKVPAKKKGRTRAVITDETRAQVKQLVKAGKSGREIAKAVGISLPSVQNVKKALALVKKN